ncbi:MAG: hypothetical protein NTW50_02655 [Candidatus Berkelbacteria bacterium]|nr:hypothetical protein [Candidatus Berkelbacteria bacterium]
MQFRNFELRISKPLLIRLGIILLVILYIIFSFLGIIFTRIKADKTSYKAGDPMIVTFKATNINILPYYATFPSSCTDPTMYIDGTISGSTSMCSDIISRVVIWPFHTYSQTVTLQLHNQSQNQYLPSFLNTDAIYLNSGSHKIRLSLEAKRHNSNTIKFDYKQ